jgi:uncharacterized protein GlcG (DUF336 family)
MSITHQEAQTALDAAIAKAEENGANVAVAVVDENNYLVAMMLMAGVQGARRAFLPQAAQGKAMASLLWFGQPSSALIERGTRPAAQLASKTFGDRVLYEQGAMPVKRGEQVIGAVGCAGAPSQKDEEIAAAGAAAISS